MHCQENYQNVLMFFRVQSLIFTLSVLSSSCSCTCSVQFPLEAESHLRTTTSRSPSRKEATWGTSIKTGPRNLDPLGPTCKMRQARPKKKNVKSKNRKTEELFFYFNRVCQNDTFFSTFVVNYFNFGLRKYIQLSIITFV